MRVQNNLITLFLKKIDCFAILSQFIKKNHACGNFCLTLAFSTPFFRSYLTIATSISKFSIATIAIIIMRRNFTDHNNILRARIWACISITTTTIIHPNRNEGMAWLNYHLCDDATLCSSVSFAYDGTSMRNKKNHVPACRSMPIHVHNELDDSDPIKLLFKILWVISLFLPFLLLTVLPSLVVLHSSSIIFS